MTKIFQDRARAGKELATTLKEFEFQANSLVVALPRGGVVVGFEIAKALHLSLDIVCPRKIGAPDNPEFAIGAITETGERILSEDLIEELAISKKYIDQISEQEKEKAAGRLKNYRKGFPPRALKNRTVILVDDGLATGATMRAAIKTVKKEGARSIILAIPVAPQDTLKKLEKEVDQVVCLSSPTPFYAVGQFYHTFDQTTDEEVISLLTQLPYL